MQRKKTALRDVEKNTPMWVMQQLLSGGRYLEARLKKHTVKITRKGDEYTITDSDGGTSTWNGNDKDHRRILLHRIWRWQQKTKWRLVK